MTEHPDAAHSQVERLLGGDSLLPLVRKLDRRLAKTPRIDGHITLKDASSETREAVTASLGVPPKPSGPLRVGLEALDAAVRRSGAARGLREAVTILLGREPRDPAAENRARRDAWQNAFLQLDGLDRLEPDARDYVQAICRNGVLRRAVRGSLDEAKSLLARLVCCAVALPLAEPTPLPIFAAARLGDAHALDSGGPLCRLLLRVINKGLDRPLKLTGSNERRVWSRVNVVQDELSSTVLVLNLPISGDSLVDRTLAAHAAEGEPCRLTFRQLRLHGLSVPPPPSEVFVCENPSVLAAASASLGSRSAPLICVEGQPSHAAAVLLGRLWQARATLRYHGDFDRAGLQITGQMIGRFEARPWRMSAADYLAAVDRTTLNFEGQLPSISWDAELGHAIWTHRKVLLEEAVIDSLLADLAGPGAA